jgi:ferredoxin-NADP reductase
MTPLVPADYLELINPLRFARGLRGRIEQLIDETADARTLVIRAGRGWQAHRAGQFVSIGVDINGVRHSRCYSISSAPERADGCFSITVKAVDGGRVSTHLVREAHIGGLIHLTPADGEFSLPDAATEPLLFITAGSGITPVMSMLRSLAARDAMVDAVLIHYAPTPAGCIFHDELQALAARFPNQLRIELVMTRAAGDDLLAGHFRSEHLERACSDWQTRQTYACGPRALLARLESAWSDAGQLPRLHIERFQAALAPANSGAVGGEVRFSRSGRLAQADGAKPLLEVAEGAGLAPAHGCRMGICHGCTVKLKSGCVRDLRSGQLHSDIGERVQICVCAAAGDVEIEL